MAENSIEQHEIGDLEKLAAGLKSATAAVFVLFQPNNRRFK